MLIGRLLFLRSPETITFSYTSESQNYLTNNMKLFYFFIFILSLCILLILNFYLQPLNLSTEEVWKNLAPGGGGQIQGVFTDPHVEGRVYELSDMEGIFRSDDYGESWQFIGEDIQHGMALVVEFDPETPGRIYLGTLYGLSISDNFGASWRNINEFPQNLDGYQNAMAISTIEVDPVDSKNIYLARSWNHKKNKLNKTNPPQVLDGSFRFYYSRDKGETWNYSLYDTGTGNDAVFGIVVHPFENNKIWLGNKRGIYFSSDYGINWKKINGPEGTDLEDGGNGNLGLDISPDGKFLVGSFSKSNDITSFYYTLAENAVDNSSVNWINKNNGIFTVGKYYKPKFDDRLNYKNYKILLGTYAKDRQGLYEASFTDSNNKLVGSWNRVFYANKPSNSENLKNGEWGWDTNTPPWAVAYDYSPSTWSKRQIWMADDMKLFSANTDYSNFPLNSFEERYSKFIKVFDGTKFYTSRGFNSTFNYDAASYQNYMIQSLADHGAMESYDGGYSWTRQFVKNAPSGDTVHIARTNPAIVLLGSAKGYGAGYPQSGFIHAKILSHPKSSMGSWKLIAAGHDNLAGLRKTRIWDINSAPTNTKRVFVGNKDGIYFVNSVVDLYNGEESFKQIFAGEVSRLQPHPFKQDVVYFSSTANRGLYQATKTSSDWNVVKIKDGDNDFAVTYFNGIVYIISNDGGNNLILARDGDLNNWSIILSKYDINQGLNRKAWYSDEIKNYINIQISNVAAYQNKIIVSTNPGNKWRKGFKMLLGTITDDGVIWEDFTGNSKDESAMFFSYTKRIEVEKVNGVPSFMVSTRGSGLFTIPVPSVTD